jgi:starch synthase
MVNFIMNISWICSEAVPYAKTGGLADVSTALPNALAKKGHKVSVIMPYYPQVMGERCINTQSCLDMLEVPYGEQVFTPAVRKEEISENLTFYFIEYNVYFDRPFLYDYYGEEYGDNADRFIFLSRAAMELIKRLELNPDILHTNDWHTSLCNIYLKSELYRDEKAFANTRSVLTIHNMGYQGVFPKYNLPRTGLSWDHFNYTCLEYFDNLNFLKGGIMTTDMVTTVSPTYAKEILTPDYSFSLDGALRHVQYYNRLTGILNGICTDQWNPETDKYLKKNYSICDLTGKMECKRDLQKRFNLKLEPDVPIIGLVSRFAYQKGIDVFIEAIKPMLLNDNVQFAILGSGDSSLEYTFSEFAGCYPGKIGVYIGYDNALAHIIEAGSDIFAMPSRYEPCGLNQMYSMQYGTIPLVRETGGLKDTVINYSPQTLDVSTGFTFNFLFEDALLKTLRWSIDIYLNKREDFNKLRENGMKQDFSWEHTAGEYEKLYTSL